MLKVVTVLPAASRRFNVVNAGELRYTFAWNFAYLWPLYTRPSWHACGACGHFFRNAGLNLMSLHDTWGSLSGLTTANAVPIESGSTSAESNSQLDLFISKPPKSSTRPSESREHTECHLRDVREVLTLGALATIGPRSRCAWKATWGSGRLPGRRPPWSTPGRAANYSL